MVQYLMSKNEDLFTYQGQNTVLSSVTHSMFVQTGMNLLGMRMNRAHRNTTLSPCKWQTYHSFLSFLSLCLTVKGKGGVGISNATFNKENSSPKLDEHIDIIASSNSLST